MLRALQLREIGGKYDLHTPLAQGPLRELIIQDIKANPAGWTTGPWQMCLTRRDAAAADSPNLRAVRDAPFAIVLLVDGGEGSSGAAGPAGTAAGKPVAWLRLRRNDLDGAEWAAIGVSDLTLEVAMDDLPEGEGHLCTWNGVGVRI